MGDARRRPRPSGGAAPGGPRVGEPRARDLLGTLPAVAALFLALCTLSFALYGRSLTVPFHFDDSHVIASNPGVQRLERLPQHWVDAGWASAEPGNRSYRPISMSVLTLAWWAGGGSVVPFHVVKIVLHAVLACFVFLISRRLLRDRIETPERFALAAAALWLLHPALSESTIYISAISSTLCACFYALGFWCYLRWAERGASWGWFAVALLAYAGAVLAKEEGITLPVVCALHAWLLGRPVPEERRRLLTGGAVAVAVGAALVMLIGSMLPPENARARGPVPVAEYFATQLRGAWWYAKIWWLPTDLNPDNTDFGFSKSYLEDAVVAALLWHAIVLTVSVLNRRRFPLAVFAVLAFYVTISPTSSVVVLAEPVNERRMVIAYLFLAAPTVVGAWALFRWLVPPAARGVLGATLLVTAAVASAALVQRRIDVWSAEDSLWEEVVRKNPSNGRAYNNLSVARFHAGRFAEASTLASQCLRVWPRYPPCFVNLAAAQEALGQFDDADASLRAAQAIAPTSPDVRLFYARFLAKRGRNDEAFASFAEADRLAGGRLLGAKMGMLQLAAGPLAWPPEKVRELSDQVDALRPH